MTDKSEGRAFEHHFGPRGREFERSNLQKFKCPGFARGGGGVLKFRVDRRINLIFHWKKQLELSRVKEFSTLDCHEWVI